MVQSKTGPVGPLHNQYGEEAAMAAQRYHDQVREITRLQVQSDEWERRAKGAEVEITRLEDRLSALETKLETTRETLMADRDNYKHSLTTLVGHFHTAGAIILKCLEAADSAAPKQVDMAAITKAIEADILEKKPEPEFPQILSDGV